MFAQWIEEHKKEILDTFIAIRREQGDPRKDEDVLRGAEVIVITLIKSLRGEADWIQSIDAAARQALASGTPMAAVITAARGIYLAVQGVLEQARPPQLTEWLGILGDHMLQGSQTAAHVLESSMEEQVAQQTAELEETQRMLQLVLDTIPMGIYWKDRDLAYLGCNQIFARDAGIESYEEIMGKTDFDLGWADHAERYHSDDLQLIESGVPKLDCEEAQTLPDGSQMWLRMSKVPLLDTEGNVTGILGVYDDITGLKQAELERERLQQEIIEAQQQALKELSTPVIPVMDRILVMPLIGSIDTMRARDITRSLLAGIREQRAKVVILDITGVPIVDSGVADHLNKTIQAARLKGARTIVTGISDAVAETIVDLGIDWTGIETLSDLQTGLIVALGSLGIKLTR